MPKKPLRAAVFARLDGATGDTRNAGRCCRAREALLRDAQRSAQASTLELRELRQVRALSSSALLAASIAFIRPSGPDAGTHHAAILAWSWGALAVAIVSTMVSFLVSQKAVDRQLELADNYYRQKQDDAYRAPNGPAKWTLRLNLFAGIAFLAGVGLTVWFAILSIPTR